MPSSSASQEENNSKRVLTIGNLDYDPFGSIRKTLRHRYFTSKYAWGDCLVRIAVITGQKEPGIQGWGLLVINAILMIDPDYINFS